MPNWKKVVVSGSDAQLSNITSSGNISSSGDINGNAFKIQNLTIADYASGTGTRIGIYNEANSYRGRSHFEGHITASGVISSSGVIKGYQLHSAGGIYPTLGAGNSVITGLTNDNIQISNGLYVHDNGMVGGSGGHITASGNITATGTVAGGNISSNARIYGALAAGTDNSVVVLQASDKQLVTDEIDPRVWGTTLLDAETVGNAIGTEEAPAANATLAARASTVTVAADSGNAEHPVLFVDSATGNLAPKTDPGIMYNPSGNKLTLTGDISSSGYVYSKNAQYWSTNGRVTVGNNTTNYYGPNPQGTNYYYWSRDLGTSSTTITNKTQTLNSGWKLPYKAVLTGYHLNIQGRSTTDNISFTLVYSDGMWDGDVTSTSQTLVEAEGAQTVSIASSNNFYELDRRDQFAIPVSAMTMLYPRFKKTAATGGTSYDFQLAVEYYVVQ
jgi:hypothetical protein